MKTLTTTSTLLSTLFIVAAATGFAGSASASEGIQGYIHIPNAAISGHNRELLFERSPAECAQECSSRDWCVSFDYHKENRHCDLSDESAGTVGLKTNYAGNPFDYYGAPSKVTRAEPLPGSASQKVIVPKREKAWRNSAVSLASRCTNAA